ncbi:hypothetical protein B0F90DRAFT_847481 [Multifurca ochricompacta]|uniref:Uncharacterized protein n=1 Tax=Multifurca ochricompacta TaxID=376703 RepID=A0AAD4LSP7_9AGAM|nr:hypothetical protein B0F90DRAFT_847481 [Multifurca ochricompacta]
MGRFYNAMLLVIACVLCSISLFLFLSLPLSLSPSLSPLASYFFVYILLSPQLVTISSLFSCISFVIFHSFAKKEKKPFFFLFACLLVWSLTHARAHVVSREISAPEDQIKPFSCFHPPPSPTLLSPSLSLLVVVIPPSSTPLKMSHSH